MFSHQHPAASSRKWPRRLRIPPQVVRPQSIRLRRIHPLIPSVFLPLLGHRAPPLPPVQLGRPSAIAMDLAPISARSKIVKADFQRAGRGEKTTWDEPIMWTTTQEPPLGRGHHRITMNMHNGLSAKLICNLNGEPTRVECYRRIVLAPTHLTCRRVRSRPTPRRPGAVPMLFL